MNRKLAGVLCERRGIHNRPDDNHGDAMAHLHAGYGTNMESVRNGKEEDGATYE